MKSHLKTLHGLVELRRKIAGEKERATRSQVLGGLFASKLKRAQIARALNITPERVSQLKDRIAPNRPTVVLPKNMRAEIDRRINEGQDIKQIAEELGIKKGIVEYRGVRLGKYARKKRFLHLPENQERLKILFESGKGDAEIAKEFDTHYSSISKWRKKLGYVRDDHKIRSAASKKKWRKTGRRRIRFEEKQRLAVNVSAKSRDYVKAAELCYKTGAQSYIAQIISDAWNAGEKEQAVRIYRIIKRHGLKNTPATGALLKSELWADIEKTANTPKKRRLQKV